MIQVAERWLVKEYISFIGGDCKMASDLEYIQIVESAKKGLISVGVDRSYARKLFTDVQLSTIQEDIGESLRMQKIIALTAFIVSPIFVLLTCILAILALGWWALLGLPLLLFVWMYYKSLSVRGGAGLGSISFIAVFAFALLFEYFGERVHVNRLTLCTPSADIGHRFRDNWSRLDRG